MSPFVILALIPCCQATAPAGVELQFKVPNGTRFVQTMRHSREMSTQDGAPPQRQVIVGETDYTINATSDGYLVKAQPVKPMNAVSSADANAMVGALFQRLTYDIDSEGRLRRIRGLEESLESAGLKEVIDDKLKLMGVGDLQSLATQDWADKAMLVPPALRLSPPMAVQTTTTSLPTMMGPIEGTVTIRLTAPVKCEAARGCARLDVEGRSDDPVIGSRLAAYMRETILKVARAMGQEAELEKQVPRFAARNFRYASKAWRLYEIATGLPRGGYDSRTVTGQFSVSTEPEPMVFRLVETFDYAYAYR